MKHTTILVLVLASIAPALPGSPLRFEAFNKITEYQVNLGIGGMVDLNRQVALRLHLVSAYLKFGPYDNYGFNIGAPEAIGVSAFNDAGLVFSPWRDRWRVEPYVHGGIGANYSYYAGGDSLSEYLKLQFRFGLGAERLLFFIKKAPSVFIESRIVLDGSTTRQFGGYPGSSLFSELRGGHNILLGIRI